MFRALQKLFWGSAGVALELRVVASWLCGVSSAPLGSIVLFLRNASGPNGSIRGVYPGTEKIAKAMGLS